MKRFLGCHVSASGGLENALKNAQELGVNSIQLHPSPPQRWNSKPYTAGIEESFLAQRKKSGVEKVFFHAIYLINLATPDNQKFHLSKLSLVHYLDLLSRLSGDGVIVHVGSMVDQEDESRGYEQVIKGIDWILKESSAGRLLLEVAAGSGRVIGSQLEELARIYDGVSQKERIGFVLDSQHLWASGYDLVNSLDEIINEVDKVFGIENLAAVHLNDSKTELGSKKDRHENLGRGLIGEKALRALVNHPLLKAVPFVLETPGLKEMDTAKSEVDLLKKWAVAS